MLARLLIFFLIIIGIGVGVFTQIYQHKNNTRVLAAEVDHSEELIKLFDLKNYWEKLIAFSPTYRDGYLQLAVIYYQLGDADKAHEYISKVYELDPNYELPTTLFFLKSVSVIPQ